MTRHVHVKRALRTLHQMNTPAWCCTPTPYPICAGVVPLRRHTAAFTLALGLCAIATGFAVDTTQAARITDATSVADDGRRLVPRPVPATPLRRLEP